MALLNSIAAASALICLISLFSLSPARAEDSPGSPSSSKSLPAEDDDYTTTPFTEYGEFNEEEDEAEDALFLQYGRFFGVSIGTGSSGVTGNRGLLWQGGFPLIDLKIHYWFNLNFAMDLGLFTASHFYDHVISASSTDHVDVNTSFLGASLKYYLPTQNLSAAITFAGPYVLMGGGFFYKTENSSLSGVSDPDSAFAMHVGAGLEFPVKPRKVYFALEGKLRSSTLKDTFRDDFKRTMGIDDLQGYFYTFTASFLFTW